MSSPSVSSAPGVEAQEPPDQRYLSLLVSLLSLLVIYPFVERLGRGSLIFGLFYTLIVINVIYSLSDRRRFFWVLLGLAVPATLLHWGGTVSGSENLRAAGAIISTLMLGYTAALILQDVLRAEKVTGQKVCGAICVYLIFGLIWADLYTWLAAVDPAAFSGAVSEDVPFSEMLYFSFVTLTTLGYGDFSPAGDVGRTLAVVEALLGQLYLVTVIAVLVGSLGRTALRPGH